MLLFHFRNVVDDVVRYNYNYGRYNHFNTCLIEVEWRQVFSTHSPLLSIAALLQSFVFGQEETHPGAGGGGRVLTREQEADQHPRNLVIVQGSSVSGGKTTSFLDPLRPMIIF